MSTTWVKLEKDLPDKCKIQFRIWKRCYENLEETITQTSNGITADSGELFVQDQQGALVRHLSKYEEVWNEFSNTEPPEEDKYKAWHRTLMDSRSQVVDALYKYYKGLGSHASNPPKTSTQIGELPEVKLSTFSGDIIEWNSFWDLFDSLIHSRSDLKPTLKLTHLRNTLKGPAADLIRGFHLNAPNYDEVIKLLKATYEDREMIQQTLTRRLRYMKSPAHNVEELSKFQHELQTNLRSLNNYFQKGVEATDWIIQDIVIDKLNSQTQEALFNYYKLKILNTKQIDEGLRALIGILRNTKNPTVKEKPNETKISSDRSQSKSRPVWQAAAITSPTCNFCQEDHFPSKCPTYVNYQDRITRMKAIKICLKCGRKSHFADACVAKVTCFNCKGDHWTPLCRSSKGTSVNKGGGQVPKPTGTPQTPQASGNKGKNSLSPPPSTTTSDQNNSSASQSYAAGNIGMKGGVALPTAMIRLAHGRKTIEVRGFFDTGCQRSLVHPKVLRKLGIETTNSETVNITAFGQKSKSVHGQTVKLRTSVGNRRFNLSYIVTNQVNMPIDTPGLELAAQNLKDEGFFLADPLVSENIRDVQIIMGSDYFPKFIGKPKMVSGVNVLTSLGGYLIYGELPPGRLDDMVTLAPQTLTMARVSVADVPTVTEEFNPALERLWELEYIGISNNKYSPDERETITNFSKTIEYDGNKYWVQLPFKHDPSCLPTNYRMARGQLNSLLNSLRRDPDKLKMYNEGILKLLSMDFVEEVNEPEILGHYLPHHPVLKKSMTTPLRVVFNASAKCGRDSLSLNDVLQTGPSLTERLIDSLISFRQGQYAVSADISKAFLRVGLQEADRDYVRFLWVDDPMKRDPVLRTFRFKSVPFGSTSSPFLLQATLYRHFENSNSPLKEVFAKSFYVENFSATVDEESALNKLFNEFNKCLHEAGMPMQEWNNNSPQFNSWVNDPDRVEVASILGVTWNTRDDTVNVKSVEFERFSTLTKRNALSFISSLYDPLGLVSPVSIRGKLLMRDLWMEKVGWDEDLEENWVVRINELLLCYKGVSNVIFERRFANIQSNLDLQVFCDASMNAFGAVAYVVEEGVSSLVMSKSRVTPLRSRTIPQLELTATLLGCRLAKFLFP